MKRWRIGRGLHVAGMVVVAISAGLVLAGITLDEAAGQALAVQAGSAEVAPGLGGLSPDGGTPAATARTSADLPFTGLGAIPIALTGMLLFAAGLVLRRDR